MDSLEIVDCMLWMTMEKHVRSTAIMKIIAAYPAIILDAIFME